MARLVAKIDLEKAGGQNRLSLDFCSRISTGLPPYLTGVPGSEIGWREAADRMEKGARGEAEAGWREVVDGIVSLSVRLGTREDVTDRLTDAAARGDRRYRFVVTGQQPGALGGPLLTLYKLYTAVALAEKLERLTGEPFVPLFWCGADDTDFDEIRGLSLVTARLTPVSTAIAQQAHRPGLPAGDIGLQWIHQVWQNVSPFVDEFPEGAFVSGVVTDAFRGARDHGEHAAGVLVGLTRGAAAVVDGRSPAIRRYARSLLVDYVENEDEIKRAVIGGGEALERAGYHAQVAPGDDSGIFLVEDGVRKSVTREMRPALAEAVRMRVEACSPGVVARNILQDAVLGPVAVVLGPAEIAYRAQIAGLYTRFGIGVPVPVPRLTATFLPPVLADLVDAEGAGSVDRLLRDPAEFARSVFDRAVPSDVAAAARDLERRVSEVSDAYFRTIENVAPPKAASRVKARIADLKNRSSLAAGAAAEVGRAIALERWPFLADIASLVEPAGKPQERTISALVPFLFAGEHAAEDLHDVAAGYADDLLDGRASHAVYSSTT